MPLYQVLIDYPGLLLALTALLGALVGSFLNVVIHRLPVMMERQWRDHCAELLDMPDLAPPDEPFNLVRPRSRCPSCGHLIAAWQNIPVVSYLLLRGRCAACGSHISSRYPIVELLTAALSVAVVWRLGPNVQALCALGLTWALIALTFIDLEHQLLPDGITQPFLWAGIALSLPGVFVDSRTSIIGALAGYLALWTFYWVFRLLTGKQGMGYGDFKLLALLGAWLGWQSLPLVILISSVSGALAGAVLILSGQDRTVPIPYGPHLAMGGWIALLWGGDITAWYLSTWMGA